MTFFKIWLVSGAHRCIKPTKWISNLKTQKQKSTVNFNFLAILLENSLKNSPTLAEIQNWLKTHRKVVNAQNKHVIQHFGGCWHKNYEYLLWANIRRRAKICGLISGDVQRSFGKCQQTCVDLWANISRCAKIFLQISAEVQRSILGKYQKTCKDLWANISSGAKICGPISADARRSKGKYKHTYRDLLWPNISKAQICG